MWCSGWIAASAFLDQDKLLPSREQGLWVVGAEQLAGERGGTELVDCLLSGGADCSLPAQHGDVDPAGWAWGRRDALCWGLLLSLVCSASSLTLCFRFYACFNLLFPRTSPGAALVANRPDGGRDQQRVGQLEYRSCHRRRAASACGCALGGRWGTGPSQGQHVSQPREQPPRVSQLCFFSPWLC